MCNSTAYACTPLIGVTIMHAWLGYIITCIKVPYARKRIMQNRRPRTHRTSPLKSSSHDPKAPTSGPGPELFFFFFEISLSLFLKPVPSSHFPVFADLHKAANITIVAHRLARTPVVRRSLRSPPKYMYLIYRVKILPSLPYSAAGLTLFRHCAETA